MIKEEEEENAAQLKLGGVFSKAQTLTNAEVFLILEAHIHAKRQDDAAFNPTPQMQRVVTYTERFMGTKGPHMATAVKTTLIGANLEDFEVAALANLMPENVEEARHLLPTLETQHPDLTETDLQQCLDDINKLRREQ